MEGHRLTGPQRAHDVDGLVEPRPALTHGDAAGIELPGELAADARAEHEATAREVVDRDDLLRDRGGRAQRHQVHAGAEGQALGYRRRVAQAHERVEDRRGVRDVLAAPQGVEAEVLGERDGLPDLPPGVASRDVMPIRTVSSSGSAMISDATPRTHSAEDLHPGR